MARVRKLSKKAKKQVARKRTKLPLGITLFWRSLLHVWKHKKLFGGVLAGYIILSYVLVSGTGLDLSSLQDGSTAGRASEALSKLFSGRGSVDDASSVYEGLLFVVFSLMTIRLLRKTFDTETTTVTIRNLYYGSTTQLVPYLLVLLVILVQLLPGILGLSFFAEASKADVLLGAGEWAGWMIFSITALAVTLYFVCSSIFASYIATLPGVQPLDALRSARRLVKHRRLLIIPKLLFLPLISFIVLAMVCLPIVLVVPAIASGLFMIVSLLLVMIAHTYLYLLYRELL